MCLGLCACGMLLPFSERAVKLSTSQPTLSLPSRWDLYFKIKSSAQVFEINYHSKDHVRGPGNQCPRLMGPHLTGRNNCRLNFLFRVTLCM